MTPRRRCGTPTDVFAVKVAHRYRLARPFLDVVLPGLTRSTPGLSSVEEALQYDLRQRIMATDLTNHDNLRRLAVDYKNS